LKTQELFHLDARTRPKSGASEPVAPVENEDEGLADVCLALLTAATEWRGSGEVNLFALLIFLCGKNRLLFHFLKWPNLV